MLQERETTRLSRPAYLGLGSVILGYGVLAGWAYLSGLDLSLWHDEAFTVLRWVERGPNVILFAPYSPNNHVLFSLLAWTSGTFAGFSETVLRFWAVAPSLAAIAVVGWWLWRRFDSLAATLFVVFSVTSPLYFQLARVARGYGLTFLATALLLVFSHRMIESQRRSDTVGMALGGAIGVASLPVFVLPFLISSGVTVALTRAWKRVITAVLLAGLASSPAYATRLPDLIQRSSQEFGSPLRWFEPATAWVFHFVLPSARLIVGLDPGANASGTYRPTTSLALGAFYMALFAFLGAMIALQIFIWRCWRQDRAALMLVLAPLFGTYLLVGVFRFHLIGRFVSFLAPYALVAIAVAASEMVQASKRLARPFFPVVLGGLAVVVGVMTVNFVSWAQTWHEVPHENFKEAAAIALSSGSEIIFTDSVAPVGLEYYLRDRLQNVDVNALCSMTSFVFIHHPWLNPPIDETAGCLSEAGVASTRIEQQGRGRFLEVFVRTEAASASGE